MMRAAASTLVPKRSFPATDCFAGVQPDADFYRVGRMSAVVVVERALDADSALDGLTRRVECHHEAVAGRLDLLTGVLPDLPPHDLVMLIHDLMSSRLTLVLAKASGADDVGEQHGHGRRLGHGACLSSLFMAHLNAELSFLFGLFSIPRLLLPAPILNPPPSTIAGSAQCSHATPASMRVRMAHAFGASATARDLVAPFARICRTVGSTFATKASAAYRLVSKTLAWAWAGLVRFPP